MVKRGPRYLALEIRYKVPPGTSHSKVLKTLHASISREDGEYTYPENWRVAILWKNKPEAEMKADEFTKAMKESAESSPGWDFAVLNYLERKIDQEEVKKVYRKKR